MKPDLGKYRRISVIGAARSGIAAARLLKNKGYEVFLSEGSGEERINSCYVDEVKNLGIKYEFGRHTDTVYDADLVVVSPGVPQNSEVIQNVIKKKIDLVSEVEVASWFCKGKIISITGTNGKTTTTTLIGEIFRDAGYKTFVCGNIGTAFSDIVEMTDESSVVVLETSSFQLDNTRYFKPFIALILNVTPDHLDRYNSFEEYLKSKMKVSGNQTNNEHFVFNYDDEIVKKSASEDIKAKKSAFSINTLVKEDIETGSYLLNDDIIYYYYMGSENIVDTRNLIIKGQHNIYNAMASIISAKIFGIETECIRKTLENFKGVEHRLELVREINGIKFYNDSKATNVNSVWYALKGFEEPIVLLLGGKDKGNDYSQIEKEVRQHVKHIIAIGESKQKVYDYFSEILPVTISDGLDDAVFKAASNAVKGDVVLLSPACASFDMFENYEHRGREFKKIVNSL